MAFMKRKSVLPIYLVGVTWLVWAVFLPLYRPAHYIMAALASAIVYFVGKMIWPDRGYVLKDEPEPAAQPERAESEPQQPPKGGKVRLHRRSGHRCAHRRTGPGHLRDAPAQRHHRGCGYLHSD